MRTRHSPYAGIGVASIAAGPIFLAVLGLAALGSATEAASIRTTDIVGVFALLFPATAFGMIAAFIPNLAGTAVMLAFGRRHEAGRIPIMWALAGAALGGGATWQWTDAAPVTTFAFAVTGASCATICRAWAHWPPR